MRRLPFPPEQRCVSWFERRGKGMRYVYARWQCPRKKLKGSDHCSYCQPPEERERRRVAAAARRKA